MDVHSPALDTRPVYEINTLGEIGSPVCVCVGVRWWVCGVGGAYREEEEVSDILINLYVKS